MHKSFAYLTGKERGNVRILGMIKQLIILLLLLAASISDIKSREIPNRLWIAIILTGFIGFELSNIIGVVHAIPFFIAAIWTGEECMGGGDIKVIAAMGFALGYAVTLMCIIALFVILAVFMLAKWVRHRKLCFAVPLIPFLTAGYIIIIIMEVLYN